MSDDPAILEAWTGTPHLPFRANNKYLNKWSCFLCVNRRWTEVGDVMHTDYNLLTGAFT